MLPPYNWKSAIRYILGYSLILAAGGSALRLVSVLTGGSVPILQPLAVVLTLGEMLFLWLFIFSIFYLALRFNKGKWIPDWAVPLLVRNEEVAEGAAVKRQVPETGTTLNPMLSSFWGFWCATLIAALFIAWLILEFIIG